MSAQRARGRESGFTVVELLIAIVIGGIVAGTAGAAMVIGLKTTFSSAEKLNTSGNAALLSQYLVADVQGTRTSGLNTALGAGTGCSGSAAGTNLLALTWTDAITSVVYAAAYRLDGGTILRYRCNSGGSPAVRPVARDVVGSPIVAVSGAAVSMTVTVRDPESTAGAAADYSFTVRAVRRAIDSICTVLQPSVVFAPLPALLDPSQPGRLQGDVTVTFSTTGLCSSGVTVTYEYASGSTAPRPVVNTGGGTWRTTLPIVAAGAWTAGTRTLSLVAPGGTVTAPFDVVDPNACVATSAATVTPASPTVTAGGTLLTPVTVSFTTGGVCGSSGTLQFQYDGSGLYRTVTATPVGSTWTATTATASPSVSWTPGVKNFTLSASTASASGQFTVVPAATCTVTTVALAPTTATLAPGYATAGPLAGNVSVTVTTSGFCATGPTVSYQYGSAGATANLTTSGSGTTWTTTLPASAPAPWVTGARLVTATSGTTSASATLVVNGACGLATGLTLTPSTVTETSNDISQDVVVTFSSSAACGVAQLLGKYQYGNVNQTSPLSIAADNPATNADGTKRWKATISATANGENWSTGNKSVSVTVGSVVTTANLQVNP